ncbi:MAG: ribonuclease domain-containing protein [Rhodospirillales bacterium]
MRRSGIPLAFLLLAIGTALAADDGALAAFARKAGLDDGAAFIAAVRTLDSTDRLPGRYVTKAQAEKLGWRPGQDLCKAAPGKALGGDRFMNRERRLPERPGRVWREADLDYACGARGPKRLVYSSDGLRFVTTDHYRSFHEVPP